MARVIQGNLTGYLKTSKQAMQVDDTREWEECYKPHGLLLLVTVGQTVWQTFSSEVHRMWE